MINLGVIWDEEVNFSGEKPSKLDYLNEAYEVFSNIARSYGIKVYMSSFDQYSGRSLEKSWRFENRSWERREEVGLDIVMDKFRLDEETENVKMKLGEELPVLNKFELERICSDKYMTFQQLPKVVIESFPATETNMESILDSSDKAVLKPRRSHGGEGIEFIESSEEFKIPEEPENFLLQRFVDTSVGIPELDIDGVHDLRLYILSGEIVGAYIRQPNTGLKSNISQGGSMKFLEIEDLPEEAEKVAERISNGLKGFERYLIGADIAFDSEGKAHVMEINSKPGLAFYSDADAKKRKTRIMELLLKELKSMA